MCNRPYSRCQSLKPSLVFLNRASYGKRRNNDVTSQEREVTMMLRHNVRTDAQICGKSARQASLFVRLGRGMNRVIAYLASSLEPHAPPIVWRFEEINHYVGLRSDTNIPCRDNLWPLPGLLIINIHFTQCYARYYPYTTCR